MKGKPWVVLGLAIAAVVLILTPELAFDWSDFRFGAWAFPRAVSVPGTGLGAGWAGGIGLHLARLAGQYLLGVLVMFAAPRPVRRMADLVEPGGRQLLRFLAIGLLVAVLFVAVGVAAVLSMHTFPVPFLLVGIFFLIALGGTVGLTYALGRAAFRWGRLAEHSPLLSYGMGTLLLYALSQVPFLGPVVLLAAWSIGVGVVIATRFGSGRPWTLEPLMEDRTA
jgi:hypothetical protein